jgi:hypothetical protein
MALQSSGVISLNDVNVENGFAGTTLVSMNDSSVRSLFQVVSGAISLSDGYGKTSLTKLYIASNTTEINLRTWAIANGWPGSGQIEIYINSGVWVYSDTAAVPAIRIDGNWPSGLALYNNGIIMGKGGDGVGSPAISLGVSITMYSTNYILGGGGQGGGGGGGGAGGGNSTGQGVGYNAPNVTGNAIGGRNPLGSNTAVSNQVDKTNYTAYGGGAGGGGACYWDCNGARTRGGYGGGNANAGGGYAVLGGAGVTGYGGGGGYGASGGTGLSASVTAGGNAGGRGVLLNGNGITWPNGQPNSLIRGGVGN